MMAEAEWLTVAQIAERLQVNRETVRRWLRSGELGGRPLSGRGGWRVPVEEFERFKREGPTR